MPVIVVLQTEPANELLSAQLDSNALQYVIDIDFNSGSAVRPAVDSVLEVDYEVNGVVIATEQYTESVYSYPILNTHQYKFTFDAQENIQAYFNEASDTILELFKGLHDTSSSAAYVANFRLIARAYTPSGNILISDGVNYTTNYRNAVNSVIHHLDQQNLNDFDQNVTTPAEWLTEKPQTANLVCRDDDEQLALWDINLGGGATTGMTFRGYNSLGVAISVGAITVPAINERVTIFPIGPQNIINAVGWSITPPIMPDDPNMKYYDVFISSPGLTTTKRFYLVDCCKKYRLYFKNRLGQYDTLTITSEQIETYDVKSVGFEKNRGLTYSPIARGRNRMQAVAVQGWDMIKMKMRRAEAEWLKQLQLSVNVFLQIADYTGSEGYFITPVVIKDATFKNIDTSEAVTEVTFRIEASNTDRSQRN